MALRPVCGSHPKNLVTPAQKDQVSDLQKRESQIALIRKGIAPNMKFQAGTASRTVEPGTALTTPRAQVKQGPLASDSGNYRNEIPKALPKTVVAPAFPAQTAVEKPAPVGKQ